MKNNFTKRVKWNTLLIALGIFLFSASFEAKASHLMGGQITYTWVSGTTYQLTGVLYRDCDGIGLGASMPISISGAPSPTFVSLSRIAINDVSILCPGEVSECNGGTTPGIEEHIYQGNVNLPTAAVYTFSYDICCRNGAITTLSNGDMYLSAELNTILTPGNSSPNFLNKPIGNYCLGSLSSIGPNGSDPDGDVLVYSLVDARVGAAASVNYFAGFSGTNPLTSSSPIVINPNTGEISFTPSAASTQVAVMAFRAEEYRVIGGVSTKIGEVYRDIQVRLQSCSGNNPPVLSAVPNAIVQVGQNYCVNINATDAPSQNISLSAVASILPPATFNVTSSGPGFANSTFCFTPQLSDVGNTYTISVNAQDDVCDSVTTSVRTWNITVPAVACNVSISTSSTDATCGQSDGTATANLLGGTPAYSYSWNGPNGYTSFSGPTITGLEAGTYTVNISDGNNCAETATIVVGDDCAPAGCQFTNSFSDIWINNAYKAAGASDPHTYYWGLSYGAIAARPKNGVGPYTYQWSSSEGYAIKDDTKKRARLWYPTGPQWVKVEITDVGASCTTTDSIYIDWVDFTCNQPSIWYYELCNVNTNTTSCVQGTVNMRNLVSTGDYVYGPCGNPKTNWGNQSSLFEVNLFPNPSNGQFSYELVSATANNYSISIMDINGRVLYSENVDNDYNHVMKDLDLSHLSAGVYIFQVSNENNNAVKRFVIQ